MREKEVLHSPIVQTYERKLGLAEKVLFLRSVPARESDLKEVLDRIPIFYHYASTFGRYDGFIVYSMFPIESSRMIPRLIQEMKESGLIEDHYEFDLVDYIRKGADIDSFLPDNNWTWDSWYDAIRKIIKECETIDLHFEEFPKTINFDFKDIQIIMNMVENAEITLKELSDILEMSQPQVHKRIKTLESHGVIRGYYPSFMPFRDSSSITIIFKSREHAQEILCAFYRLPFFLVLSMESRSHYYVSISLPSGETDHFLQGVNILKQYTDDFLIQTVVRGPQSSHKGQVQLLSTYDQEMRQWNIPVTDYIEMIQRLSKK